MDEILKNSKNYIDLLKKFKKGTFIIRRSHKNYDIVSKEKYLTPRKPQNFPPDYHDETNNYFLKKFNWKVRDGIFCFALNVTDFDSYDLGFGKPYLIFPTDDFEYCYDENIFDLCGHLLKKKKTNKNLTINDFLQTINYKNNKIENHIEKIYENHSMEIMLNCKSYYLVDVKYASNLIDLIW